MPLDDKKNAVPLQSEYNRNSRLFMDHPPNIFLVIVIPSRRVVKVKPWNPALFYNEGALRISLGTCQPD